MQKKLYRSQENRVFAGILGGFGEYFDVDPVLLRVIFILIVIATGIFPGAIAYLIAILIVPKTASITPSTPVTDDHQPL